MALSDAVFLTGGLRVERNDGFTAGKVVTLPMLGASYVRDLGSATLKLRGAYGVGIRPARTTIRETAMSNIRQYPLGPNLDPERQSGVEFGADLFVTNRFGVHLTRFDQRASGLIQSVATPRDVVNGNTGPGKAKDLAYVLQHVCEITNRGWEFESSVNLGRVGLSGAVTTVDSRVRRIARGYTGDMLVGERMLAVPAGTASLSASWSLADFRTTLTASRAFDWINYDRLRLAKDFASCDACTAGDLTGDRLRTYWMTYDGVTRLRASVARELPQGLGLRLTLDNLTNQQSGEPDNITVLPGRTVLFGLSAKIR